MSDRKLIHADSFECHGVIQAGTHGSDEVQVANEAKIALRDRPELLQLFRERVQMQHFQDGSFDVICPRLVADICTFPAAGKLRQQVLKILFEKSPDIDDHSIRPTKCKYLRQSIRSTNHPEPSEDKED